MELFCFIAVPSRSSFAAPAVSDRPLLLIILVSSHHLLLFWACLRVNELEQMLNLSGSSATIGRIIIPRAPVTLPPGRLRPATRPALTRIALASDEDNRDFWWSPTWPPAPEPCSPTPDRSHRRAKHQLGFHVPVADLSRRPRAHGFKNDVRFRAFRRSPVSRQSPPSRRGKKAKPLETGAADVTDHRNCRCCAKQSSAGGRLCGVGGGRARRRGERDERVRGRWVGMCTRGQRPFVGQALVTRAHPGAWAGERDAGRLGPFGARNPPFMIGLGTAGTRESAGTLL